MKKKFQSDLVERWKTTVNGVEYQLELEIDRKWIVVQLGPRAVLNVGKKASQISGAVIVRVIK